MRGLRWLAIAGVVASLAAACSGSGKSAQKNNTSSTSSTTSAITRPAGPEADLSTELDEGNGPFLGAISTERLPKSYEEEEYVAAGTATSYTAVGGMPADGRWRFEPAGSAPYRTRILVRRPNKARDFSGTVVLEWLNVSGGVDAGPDWSTLHEELTRRGDIWVGVSAQVIGVMGGPVAVSVSTPGAENVVGKGLKAIDPARYGSLDHPGDGFSFDIFTQVARAIRQGGETLGGATPQRVVAIGESQSAFALVTYVDGVQPLTQAFDGFFVHSRGAAPLPLVAPGKSADIAAAINGTPVIFRTDTRVPILDVQTESDVPGLLDSAAARQPDTDRFRLWEVAGTAHADVHLVGPAAQQVNCGVPINNGALHVVAKAAFHALDAWIRTGTPPPVAPRLDVTAGPRPEIRRDADGIALGGIRTPPVDVPVDVLSGAPGPNPSAICFLLGSTKALPATRIAALYPSRTAYRRRYDAATDATIKAGFALDADRDALLVFAQPSRITAV